MWRTGVFAGTDGDSRSPSNFEISRNSTGVMSDSPGPGGLPVRRHPPKPPNLRHFRGFVIFGPPGSQKYEKGVGIVRKMIYLGRHKI